MSATQDLLKLKVEYELDRSDGPSWLATVEVTCGEHSVTLSEWVNTDGTLEEVDSHIKQNQSEALEEFGSKTREMMGFPPHDGCGNWNPVADLVIELFRTAVEAEFKAAPEMLEE